MSIKTKMGKPVRQMPKKLVERLAKTIKTDLEEEQLQDEINPVEEQKTTFQKSSHSVEQPVIDVQRIIFNEGSHPKNPFIVQKHESEISKYLEKVFSNTYIVLTERTITNHLGKRLKTLMLEDCNNFRYLIWIDVSILSMLR